MSKYVLPIASENALGGVKIGQYIKQSEDGTISIDAESINNEIDLQLNYFKQFKAEIAKAITEMGVETSENDTGITMANNIRKISTNGSLNNMHLI